MKAAIIVHGMSSREERSPSQNHWIPWIKQQLEGKGIQAYAPDFPTPYEPVYAQWRLMFEKIPIDADTILIGHSLGAGFLVRWLSESKKQVGTVVLVAPFLDPDHDEVPLEFFDFNIDPELLSRTKGLHIFISSDDDQEILISVEQIRSAIPQVQMHEFSDQGHFTMEDMGTEEFLELREVVLE